MKVLIWVHKNDVISGEITKHSYTRHYHDRHEEWVQVSISVDEFVQLEDGSKSDNDNLFKDEEALIFERNPDTGEIRSRKVGDYGNERIIKKDE